jgi:hypothetical protein
MSRYTAGLTLVFFLASVAIVFASVPNFIGVNPYGNVTAINGETGAISVVKVRTVACLLLLPL